MFSFSSSVTLDGRPCLVADAGRFPAVGGLANSYWCPLGGTAGRAWVLLARRDAEALFAAAALFHRLEFAAAATDGRRASVAFPGLVLVGAQRIAGGAPRDPLAACLVELADRRLLAQRFSDTGTVAANVRAFAQDDDYLAETAGATWDAALATLWDRVAEALGPYPGLPPGRAPSDPPENLLLVGENAWRAIGRILERIGCAAAYDPLADRFSLVPLDTPAGGAGSAAPLGSPGLPVNEPLLDAQPLLSPAAQVPETIRVWFRNHYRGSGQERDAAPAENWLTHGSAFSIDVPTAAAGAAAGTVLPLWDELPRVLGEDGQPENAAALAAQAARRAAEYLAQAAAAPQHRVFPGVVDLRPDGGARLVVWRAWGAPWGTATEVLGGAGLVAEIRGGRDVPRAVRWSDPAGERAAEPRLRPHLPASPLYPRATNLVRIAHSGAAAGETVAANGDGLHAGEAVGWIAGAMASLGPCWVLLVDEFDRAAGDLVARNGDYFGPARLAGVRTSQGQRRPLYLVRRGAAGPRYAKAQADWQTVAGAALVVCRWSDRFGSQVVGEPFAVGLPAPASREPAVFEGEVIVVVEDAEGRPIAPGYHDAPRGTVRLWATTAPLPPGWTLCDGSHGSPDMTAHPFIRYSPPAQAGTHGGSAAHNHGGWTGGPDATNLTPVDTITAVTPLPNAAHQHEIAPAAHEPPFTRLALIYRYK